jgi:hypothetical protein
VLCTSGDLLQVFANAGQIETLLTGKVGDAKSTAQIEEFDWRRRVSRKAQGQFVGFFLRLANRFSLEVLRTSKQMKAFKLQLSIADFGQQFWHELGIDTKLLGTAPHFHS